MRVRARRRELRLGSQAKTAATAGISEPTWGNLENAKQSSYKDFVLDPVCRVLCWTPDSIDRILEGGEPIELAVPQDPTAEDGSGERALALLHFNAGHPSATDWEHTVAAMLTHHQSQIVSLVERVDALEAQGAVEGEAAGQDASAVLPLPATDDDVGERAVSLGADVADGKEQRRRRSSR